MCVQSILSNPYIIPTLNRAVETIEPLKAIKHFRYHDIVVRPSIFSTLLPKTVSESKMTKDVYSSLSDTEMQCLRYISNQKVASTESVDRAIKFSKAIKESLDKTYGKKGYHILGIGRSPSGCITVMENLGASAKNFPFSMYPMMDSDFSRPILPEVMAMKLNWGKYFKKFGITPNMLTDKSKTTILTDYSHTGRTLVYCKKLLDEIYPGNNIKAVPLQDLASNLDTRLLAKHRLSTKDISAFTDSLADCDFKFNFATCQHFRELSEYKNAQNNYVWDLPTKVNFFRFLDTLPKKKKFDIIG